MLWWAGCVGVWLLSLSAFSGEEFVVAAVSAGPCAACAVAARRAMRGWWPGLAVGREALLALPVTIITDAVRVLALPYRPGARRSGHFRQVALPIDRPGRHAVTAILLSSTPGAYVVDVDPEQRTALVHAVSAPSRLEIAMRR
jgi:multisubunit Na+/H+ antiporter MnhE subunit